MTTYFVMRCGYHVSIDGLLIKDGKLIGQYRSMNQAIAAAEALAKAGAK